MPLNHTSKYSELTNEQFCLIGKIVIEFSNIEFLLGEILGRLLFTPGFLSWTYTESITAAKLQDAVANALELHRRRYKYKFISNEIVDKIKTVNSRVQGVRGKRNQFAHLCWFRSNDNEIFGVKFSGKMPTSTKKNKDSVTLTMKQLYALYKECYLIVEEMTQIHQALPAIEEESLWNNK